MNQPDPGGQLDVKQLRDSPLPASSFPPGNEPFRIFLSPQVHDQVWKHGRETPSVEICGVLVGTWGQDAAGPFAVVTETIRGEGATTKFAEVTFTHETWAKINHEMDTRFANLSIIGWYHTHPDFGVFLSDRDVFIHQHFFANPGQVAYVVDPVRKTEGIFVWRDGQPKLAPHYWVGDRIQVGGAVTAGEEAPPAPAANKPAAPTGPGEASPLLTWTTIILALVLCFLLGYLVSGHLANRDRLQMEKDAIAQAALWLGIKPGLRESLDSSIEDLKSATRDADALAGSLPEDQKKKWEEVRAALLKNQDRLQVLKLRYGMTPEQTEHMLRLVAAALARDQPGLTPREREQMFNRFEDALRVGIKKGLFELPLDPEKKPPAKAGDKTKGGTAPADKK